MHPVTGLLSGNTRGLMKITTGLLFAALALGVPLRASAVLGGDVDSVQADQAQFRGTVRVTKMITHTVHEIHTANGVILREYVSPAGQVFGVAWQGRVNPDLRQVLGSYYDQFLQATRAQTAVRGRPFLINQPGLVVQMSGTMRAHFGRAYVPSMVPNLVQPESIR